MTRHVGCDLVENAGDLDQLGVAGAVDLGDLASIGGDLPGILVQVGMVGVDDVVGEKGQLPGCVVLAPLDRRALRRLDLPFEGFGVELFLGADGGEGRLSAAAEIDPVSLKDRRGPVILGLPAANT
jgi:hypothetical protein